MTATELCHTALYAAGFLVLFGIGELLYHVLKLPAEITRKFVHLFTGMICLSFPFVLTSHWSVLILTVSFVAILVASMRFKLLRSINGVDRKTRGSFLFPIVIYGTFWIYSVYGRHSPEGTAQAHTWNNAFSLGGTIYYFLPILLLSVSDPLAALVGKRWPYGKYTILNETKTIAGSLAFFTSALALSVLLVGFNSVSWQAALIIATCIAFGTTLVEAVSQKGFDNLLIPLCAVGILILFRHSLIL